MYHIALTNAVSDWGMEYLRRFAEIETLGTRDPQGIVAGATGMDAVLCRGIDDMSETFFKGLAENGVRVCASHGTGLDGCDLEAATKYGIPVVYAPGANSRAVAEFTVSIMLTMIKKINMLTEQAHRNDLSNKSTYCVRQFKGMNLYVVGFGNIGRQVAQMCQGLGMAVSAYDKYLPKEKIEELGCKYCADVFDGLADADIVTIHTPLTEETKGIANAKMFDRMKPGAFFVNTARPGLMDEDEVITRVEDGRLSGAALDATSFDSGTPNPRLLGCEKIVLSYHIASRTDEAMDAMAKDCADGIEAVLNHKRWSRTANPEVYDILGY